MSQLTTAQILGTAPLQQDGRPNVRTNQLASVIAQSVADNLPYGALYRYRDEYMTICTQIQSTPEGSTYKILEKRVMTANRFATWIEQFMTFSPTEKDPVESLSKVLAEKILASDYLRMSIPEIREICPVRLPAWSRAADGGRVLSILPSGYDPETRIYSAETVSWDPTTTYPQQIVIKTFRNLLSSFPWGENGHSTFTQIRSVACFMAYMIGQFCRHLISRQPMVLFNGNQPGTGKTLLAKLGLGPVHGKANVNSFPRDEASLQKMLFTKLMGGAQYVLIDDLNSLNSTTINQYATSDEIADRVLGTNTEFCGENRMQIIGTGNNLPTTPDIERRSMIIDLFDVVKSIDKNIQNPTSENIFNKAEWRSDMLACLWSLVWSWSEAGCPILCSKSAMPSFESFAEVVGSIVMHAGFISPFTRREAATMEGGDVRGATIERLLIKLAMEIHPEAGELHTGIAKSYTVKDVMEIAESLAIVDIICSGKNPNQSLGHQLRKLKGRQYMDGYGRRFTFGRREDAVSSLYNVVILSEPSRGIF